MKKGLVIIMLLAWFTDNTFSQSKNIRPKAEQNINLSFMPQLYLNKGAVIHRYKDWNQQVLYPKNTIGYNMDVEYQRTTRYGFVYSAGIQIGMQKHDVGVHYNLGYVDEDVPQLKGITVDTHYAATIHNAGLRLMAGYRWQSSNKKLSIIVKGGATFKYTTTPLVTTETRWMVGYLKNDTFWIKRAGYDFSYFGAASYFGGGMHIAGNLYLGVTQNVNWAFINSLSIGIEGTRGLYNIGSGYIYETLDKIDSYTGELIDRGQYDYAPLNWALGIRFTVGLWP